MYQYDKTTGALVEYTNPAGHATTFTSDPATGHRLSRTDGLGHTWKYTWGQGNLTSVEDPEHDVWSLEYDPSFNLPTSVISRLGQKWATTYDSRGNLKTMQDPSSRTTTYACDEFGQITTVTSPRGRSLTLSYDSSGAVASVTNPVGQKTTMTVDPLGRVTAVTDPAGRTSSVDWDRADRAVALRDPLGNTVANTWDAASNLISRTDPMGRAPRSSTCHSTCSWHPPTRWEVSPGIPTTGGVS